MDAGGEDREEREADSPGGRPGRGDESAFRLNLEAFGGRAARLCGLLRRGRITPDGCFLALTQLWVQLARSHRGLDEGSEDGAERTDG